MAELTMKQRPHTRVSKLPKRIQEPVNALLTPLVKSFPLAELFWEEQRRTILEFNGNDWSLPSQDYAAGAQLRVVGARSSAMSWTSDLSAHGLRAAFNRLDSGHTSPSLPHWPEPDSLRLSTVSRLRPLCEAAADILARLRDRTRASQRLRAQLSFEDYLRGSADGPEQGRQWRASRVMLRVEIVRRDGSLIQRARLLDGTVGPEDLAASGLLEDVIEAWRRDTAKAVRFRGVMPVVVAHGQGAVIFHELVGHSLEADHVLCGTSPFSKRTYGQQVSHTELTIVDSPRSDNGCGGITFDDEGQTPAPVTLIEAGAIRGMLHDRVTATMTGSRPTGNGRREDFRTEPQPRMRNIVVAAGPHTPDSLLSGIRRGLYVERLGDGRADLSSGHFTLMVEAGRRIERGTLGEPVRNLLIRGNTLETLSGIEGVGRDFRVSPEPIFCGKRGVVMTGVAGPTVRLNKLEVFS